MDMVPNLLLCFAVLLNVWSIHRLIGRVEKLEQQSLTACPGSDT